MKGIAGRPVAALAAWGGTLLAWVAFACAPDRASSVAESPAQASKVAGSPTQPASTGPVMVGSRPPGTPPCALEPGRKAESIGGTLLRGESFALTTTGGWMLKLVPAAGGWFAQVTARGREDEDLSRLTPPWHGVPNPRMIEAWHFRNADNTGPNDGSVNAPGDLREFIFSPDVGRGITFDGSATPAEAVEKVRAYGRVWLHVDQYRLMPPRQGQQPTFEWLQFTACVTWPAV